MPRLTLGRGAMLTDALASAAAALRRQRPQSRPAATARPPVATDPHRGTVILPFGRYFAGRADMLTRDGFKTVVPIDGVSPFSGVGSADPELQHYADGERVNERARTDVRKDLAERLGQSGAEYLVVDNSTALMLHREIDGRLYALFPGEATDLMDLLWNADAAEGRARAVKLSHAGLTDGRRSIYDAFVRACLDSFDPARIVLVRSHAARFWVAEDGSIAPTNVDRRDASFLDALDRYFLEQTGCRVASGTLGHFPTAVAWQTFDHGLRRVIEDDLAALCRPHPADNPPAVADTVPAIDPAPRAGAADHVVGAVRANRPVNRSRLQEYFAAGGVSFDDLLALAYLEQQDPAGTSGLVRTCVRHAVADPGSQPQAATRRRFERSVRALSRWPWSPLSGLRGWRTGSLARSLRGWRWGSLPQQPGPPPAGPGGPGRRLRALHGWWRGTFQASVDGLWSPQIAVPCGPFVFRFASDGSLRRVPLSPVGAADAEAIVDGRLPITPHNLRAALGSWPAYFERGRRGVTAAPRVVVSGVDELVDSCAWIDWANVLEGERVVITNPNPASVPARGPDARTDLSFLFHPDNRIVTVGGGLMDQITHIALFDELCRPHGLDYYLDDFRYTWWRSHNGFEASRLAPDLERRRMTRRVSQALIESFRDEVMRTRLPWVFNQSRTWYDFGLPEATVVTVDYTNSRRLMETGPDFPVFLYERHEDLGELVREPPAPVCFFTTQQLIPLVPESAVAIRRVFSYEHLEAKGLDADVARTAELLRNEPHLAFHVRRGDYLLPHFDTTGWNSQQHQYVEVIDHLIESELGTTDFNVAVFSDDLDFVAAHASDYGLDRVTGTVRFMRGNNHYRSIFDSYLMSLCPVIVGSVGAFAAGTSLLADPPSVFIRSRPTGVTVDWRRTPD